MSAGWDRYRDRDHCWDRESESREWHLGGTWAGTWDRGRDMDGTWDRGWDRGWNMGQGHEIKTLSNHLGGGNTDEITPNH